MYVYYKGILKKYILQIFFIFLLCMQLNDPAKRLCGSKM